MIQSYKELDDRHFDVLGEIGNIGSGNAATSLSLMLDEGVNISVPQVKLLDYDGVIRALGDPEDLAIAIMIKFTGDLRGVVLFLLEYDDARKIAEMLIRGCEEGVDTEGLSELMVSTVKEIGNILGSSYLGSISTLTGLKYEMSVPHVSIDMVGSIMSAPMLECSVDEEKILMIEGGFSTEEKCLKSHVILFADLQSLNKVMAKLGIER